ncbi:MAG TPA: XRE family transcriptional regulator [bacterium]|nr:XRE family transcriptional regulator [bacterium]
MKKVYAGKTGKTRIYGSCPKSYFNRLMKSSPAAAAGYEEEVMKNLVSGLNKALVRESITPYALAKRAGLRPQVVKRVLNGAGNAEINTISRIGECLDLRLAWKKK